MKRFLIAALCIPAFASAETVAPAPEPKQARIIFPGHNIRNWAGETQDVLYIESQRKWYRADLFAPCRNLPYALGIGFEANPTGEFNRFSRIVVEGETCQLKSLVQVEGPPAKAKKRKA